MVYYIRRIELEEVVWLAKFGVIKEGETGLLEDDGPETLPYFDDFELSPSQVEAMLERFEEAASRLRSKPGFTSVALDKFEKILKRASQERCGLQAFCD